MLWLSVLLVSCRPLLHVEVVRNSQEDTLIRAHIEIARPYHAMATLAFPCLSKICLVPQRLQALEPIYRLAQIYRRDRPVHPAQTQRVIAKVLDPGNTNGFGSFMASRLPPNIFSMWHAIRRDGRPPNRT